MLSRIIFNVSNDFFTLARVKTTVDPGITSSRVRRCLVQLVVNDLRPVVPPVRYRVCDSMRNLKIIDPDRLMAKLANSIVTPEYFKALLMQCKPLAPGHFMAPVMIASSRSLSFFALWTLPWIS